MKRFLFTVVVLMITVQVGFSIYQELEVDGLRIYIDFMDFTRGASGPAWTIDLNETVDLTDDPSEVFEKGFEVELVGGAETLDFDNAFISFSGGFDIKGHTYVESASEHVYTSTLGIQSYSSSDSTFVPPADYDYLHYPWIFNPSGTGDIDNVSTELRQPESIAADSSPILEFLVDLYAVAFYWNGDDATRHGDIEFTADAYPAGTPVIVLSGFPFFVAVNRNVIYESYVASIDPTDLAVEEGYDVKRVVYMTLLFDESNGEVYQGGIRNGEWHGLTSLPPLILDGTRNSVSYDLHFYGYTESSPGSWTTVFDSYMTGFIRQAIGETGSATYEGSDEYEPNTVYYKRVR